MEKALGLCMFGLWIHLVNAYNILLLPFSAGGHMATFAGLAEELDKQGHRVYTLAVVSNNIKIPQALRVPPNRTILEIEVHDDGIIELCAPNLALKMFEEGTDFITTISLAGQAMNKSVYNLLMANEPLLAKIETLNLDLAIVDDHATLRHFHLVPHRLGIPVVSLIFHLESLHLRIPQPPSFVPLPYLPFYDKMTFIERLTTLLAVMGLQIFPVIPVAEESVQNKYRKYGDFDSVDDVGRKSLLWIQVTDPVLDFPQPLMPHVVQVGALSVRAEKKRLDSTLAKFVDGAYKGLVVMTFGSYFDYIPADPATRFLKAFEQLRLRVVWRFVNKDNLKIPENVFISSWLPQSELLGHSATKLFITHCGANGQLEAISHGVPMIGFPIKSGDTRYNAARAERRGFGITMDFLTFQPKDLVENIGKILNDTSYQQRTSEAAQIIKERTGTPAEKAVFWIEHVMLHRTYLRSPALEMDLYKFLMLDLFVAVAVFCVLSTCSLLFCLRFVYRICICRKQKQD